MDHLYKRIVTFQHKCNDYIDDHAHAVARSLKNEVQRLPHATHEELVDERLVLMGENVVRGYVYCSANGSGLPV